MTLANNIMSFSFHAYQAELYPTRIRAAAVGFVYSWSRLSVVFSAFVIAFFLDRFGVAGVFTLIAASMLVVMLAINGNSFGPPTSRLPRVGADFRSEKEDAPRPPSLKLRRVRVMVWSAVAGAGREARRKGRARRRRTRRKVFSRANAREETSFLPFFSVLSVPPW